MGEILNSKVVGDFALRCLLTLIALGMVITGCASQGTFQTQMDLGSCGFAWKIADTPEKLKQVESFPQRQIVHREKDGKVYYIYADARDCKCVYIGDEKAYQQYKQFVFEKRQDRKNDIAAEQAATITMDSGFWGAFGPWPW